MTKVLKPPFPYFGGKSRVASLVWSRLGNVPNYVEPFAGSLAIPLARPHTPKIETVNDADCYLANFWRALLYAPDEVAHFADYPVNEADLHARHRWLLHQVEFRDKMKTDPEFYDAKIAGWWVWGISCWIGSGWCQGAESWQIPHLGDGGRGGHRAPHQCPHLGNSGTGDERPSLSGSKKRPHLANAGKGVSRLSLQIPHLSDAGTGDARSCGEPLHQYLHELAARLRRVRVCCGDWARVLGPSVTFKHGLTGIFLDPPYAREGRADVYSMESDCAPLVRQWCLENGDNRLLRIALCGYAGEGHDELEGHGWECVAWKAAGGYGSQGDTTGRDNASRERIWFSPACLKPQLSMFQEEL